MRTKLRRSLASLVAAAMAFMIAVIALPEIEVSAADTQLPVVLSRTYVKNFYRWGADGELVDGISDFTKVTSIKLNVVANKKANVGMQFGTYGAYTVEGFNDWNIVLEANEPKDMTISGKVTDNGKVEYYGGFFYFQPFSTGYDPDITIKVNSMEYLDADGNVLAADTKGAVVKPNYVVSHNDLTDWSDKKGASIDKALVTVDLGKYDVATTNADLFAVRLTRDSGSFEKVVGVKYGKAPEGDNTDFSNTDIILEKDGVNTVEIPLNGSASKGIELAVNGTIKVTDIKFVDKQGNTVIHVGHPQAGNVGADSEIGAGAPDTKLENAGNIKLPLTSEEQAAVNGGKDINVTLSVNNAQVNDADKEAIDKKAAEAGSFTVGAYLDIKLFKEVAGFEKTAVTELGDKIDVAIVIPASLLPDENHTREYLIVHLHNGVPEIINGTFDASSKIFRFKTDKFSTYAIAYKDTPKEEEPEPEPVIPVYSVIVNGNARVSGAATAGSEMTVSMPIGFVARVYNGSALVATIYDGGSFTMPAGNVVVNVTDESGAGMMAYVAPNTYIFSYTSDMKLIKTSRSKKGIAGTGEMTVDLGAAYAGKTVTLYSGKKSTSEKITEAVLDSRGRATFTVKGAKNYTLVVEED